jgi:Capsule assembly protein Wzi
MQIIKSLIKLLVFVCPVSAMAQSTYLNQGAKEYHFIDRLEIKQQTNTHLNFSTLRPFNRKYIVQETEFLDSARMGYKDSTGVDKYKTWTDLDLTPIDEYNLRSLLMNNSEWVTVPREDFISKKPILKELYKTKANMVEVNNKDFFLAVNPILQIHQAIEPGYDKSIFLNSRGISVRGLIAKRIGFSSFVTDNQERGPRFFQQQVNQFRAVPGVGFYKNFKDTVGVDYFDARGYVTFNATKYINFQFGYDKNFIGNGYRSLLLSDWGNSYLFAKINTKIWKLNYQNIFMELMPQFYKTRDTLLDRKYAAMHHLSMNVTKWLNIGLFEGVVFGRKNRFDFQYLNPIIFYRHIEGQNGSPDNAVAGLDFKANIAHRMQFYGQFMLDEFVIGELRSQPKSWRNKFGIQAGFKYVDAFGVRNLDIQGETNRVRPFTYAHYDTVANYTHYNQPLAHPLGANFQEFIGIIHYQPAPKWTIYARAIYYNQGVDTLGLNFGGNIFKDYRTRLSGTGSNTDFGLGDGANAKCLNINAQVSYELRENLFFEASFQSRLYKIQGIPGQSKTTLVTAGVRLNMFKRNYDF